MSQVSCAGATEQPGHGSLSTPEFIRFANGIDLSARRSINSHPTPPTETAAAEIFSEDKQLRGTIWGMNLHSASTEISF